MPQGRFACPSQLRGAGRLPRHVGWSGARFESVLASRFSRAGESVLQPIAENSMKRPLQDTSTSPPTADWDGVPLSRASRLVLGGAAVLMLAGFVLASRLTPDPFMQGQIKDHSKVIDILRPELDAIALTTYPSPFHETPKDLPHDYYSWVYQHIPKNEAVLFMEMGWPTKGSGNELEQQVFIKKLPNLLVHVNTSVIAWALLHDVELPQFDANLNSVGLITKNGRKKPGYNAFKQLNNSLKN